MQHRIPFAGTALVLLLTLALAASAHASVRTFARAGTWQAFGGTANNGTPLCGMSSRGNGLWFGVKYFKGNNGFTIQLSSKRWTLKRGVKVNVSMQFDNQAPWSASATGFHMTNGNAALEFSVPRNKLGLWLREFRNAATLVVGFPNQKSISDWRVGLSGTTTVSAYMISCIDKM